MDAKYPSICKINPDDRSERMNELIEKFRIFFSADPTLCIRTPGRVNLIGDHIDYCSYPVFPMAIKQDILMVASQRKDGKLCLKNISSVYEDFTCDINDFEICDDKPYWYKYFLCGILGIKDHCGADVELNGLSVAVSGNIPPSAGLSSSSAMVCGAALAITHLQGISLTSNALTEICAKSERYIGTLGGGMDQAAILLSSVGYAQMIEFNPLKSTSIRLPDGASFVIANSLSMKNKAASSDYNCRVVECRLACRLLALKLNLEVECTTTLGELQRAANKSLPEMIELVKGALHPEAYSKEEIGGLLGWSIDALDEKILSENTRHISKFELYKRALHVFSEANLVLEFKDVCTDWLTSEKTPAENAKALKKLGVLMDSSHTSLKCLYESSHPSLDKLVELSKEIALGARVTGAGWGGCIVALVLKEKVQDYIHHLTKHYYQKEEHVKSSEIPEAIFSTAPSKGACSYTL